MSEELRLHRGAFMRRGGIVWRVKLLVNGVINLENPVTGEVGTISLEAWERGCFEGLIEMVADPNAEVDESTREVLSVPPSDMRPSMRKAVERIGWYIQAYRDPYAFYREHFPERPAKEMNIPRARSKRWLDPFLADVAAAYGDPDPPGASTFNDWLGKIAKSGTGDPRAAVPRNDLRGPKERHMNPMVRNWLDDIIDKKFLVLGSCKRIEVFEELRDKVDAWNEAHPDRKVTGLSERQVRRYIGEEIDQETDARRRFGKDYADDMFRRVGIAPEPDHILDVVECDHTRVNINLLDDATGLLLGRPTVSVAQDRKSRIILAADIHFEGPTLGAVFRVLKGVMSPKDFPKEWGLDDYLVYGIPVRFFFDKGTDWDNDHIRDVSHTQDIAVDYEPAGCPELKGGIERLNRTIQEEVSHTVAGATPPRGKGGFVRDGEAYMYVSEYKKRFWLWATQVYARRPHSALGDSPMNVWLKGKVARPIRPLRKKDDLKILMTRVELLTPRKTGVKFQGLFWGGDVFKEIMTHPGWTRHDRKGSTAKIGIDLATVGKVKVRFNEENLAEAWVTHPISRKMVQLDPSMPEYMKGLTLHQHILSTRLVDQYMDGLRNEKNLLRAKRMLREQAEDVLRRKSSRNLDRVRAARVLEKRFADPDEAKSVETPVETPVELDSPETKRPRRSVKIVRGK